MYGRLVASLVAAIVAATALVSSQAARGFLARPSPAAIRILTWNVYRDTIFPAEGEDVDVAAATRPAQFARVMNWHRARQETRQWDPVVSCVERWKTHAHEGRSRFKPIVEPRYCHSVHFFLLVRAHATHCSCASHPGGEIRVVDMLVGDPLPRIC